MAGALMWATYGVLIGALPVVVANILVFAAAGASLIGSRFGTRDSGLGIRDSGFAIKD